MSEEDERRLQRERDIAFARRGPDYSIVEQSVAKANHRHRQALQEGARQETRYRAQAQAEGYLHTQWGGHATKTLEASRTRTTARIHRLRQREPNRS